MGDTERRLFGQRALAHSNSKTLVSQSFICRINKNIRNTIYLFLIYSDIFKLNKLMTNFQEILNNIFLPLFEVTNDPHSHPELHKFLQYVS